MLSREELVLVLEELAKWTQSSTKSEAIRQAIDAEERESNASFAIHELKAFDEVFDWNGEPRLERNQGVASKIFGLNEDDLDLALRNVGVNISCGACAEVFFTGACFSHHDENCELSKASPRIPESSVLKELRAEAVKRERRSVAQLACPNRAWCQGVLHAVEAMEKSIATQASKPFVEIHTQAQTQKFPKCSCGRCSECIQWADEIEEANSDE